MPLQDFFALQQGFESAKKTKAETEALRLLEPFLQGREIAEINEIRSRSEYQKESAASIRQETSQKKALFPWEERAKIVDTKRKEKEWEEFMKNAEFRQSTLELQKIMEQDMQELYKNNPKEFGRLMQSKMRLDSAQADVIIQEKQTNDRYNALNKLMNYYTAGGLEMANEKFPQLSVEYKKATGYPLLPIPDNKLNKDIMLGVSAELNALMTDRSILTAKAKYEAASAARIAEKAPAESRKQIEFTHKQVGPVLAGHFEYEHDSAGQPMYQENPDAARQGKLLQDEIVTVLRGLDITKLDLPSVARTMANRFVQKEIDVVGAPGNIAKALIPTSIFGKSANGIVSDLLKYDAIRANEGHDVDTRKAEIITLQQKMMRLIILATLQPEAKDRNVTIDKGKDWIATLNAWSP